MAREKCTKRERVIREDICEKHLPEFLEKYEGETPGHQILRK